MTINTLLHQHNSNMDEFILEIFEEQEEQFYFPVTSQNQARAFVKALHTKGLAYEALCEEIGEIEHNFSAWRKGVGRAGIGSRMIDRINQPLHEVLESDDEEVYDDNRKNIMKQSKSEVKQHKEATNGIQNHTVQNLKATAKPKGLSNSVSSGSTNAARDTNKSTKAPASQDDALKEYRERLQKISRNSPDTGSPRASPAADEVQQKDSSKSSSGCSSSQSSSSASPAISRHVSSKEQKKEIASSLLNQIDKRMSNLERRISDAVDRKRNTSSSTSSRSSSQEKEEFQHLVRRKEESPQFGRRELDQDKRHSSPPEKPLLDDLLRKQENGNFQRGNQDEKRRSVRDRISLFNDLQDIKKESPKVSRENSLKRSSRSPNSMDRSPDSEKDVVQNVQMVMQADVTMDVEQNFVLDTEETVETSIKLDDKQEQPKQEETKTEDQTDLHVHLQEKEFDSLIEDLEADRSLPEMKEEASNEENCSPKTAPLATNDLMDFMDDEETAESSDDSKDHEAKKVPDPESDSSSTESTSTESLPGTDTQDRDDDDDDDDDDDEEIDENYDSDIDPENDDHSSDFLQLLKQLSAHKGQIMDGPGYIYAFTDSPNNAKEQRLKIGASRHPNKRLEQAMVFNIDMKLASAVSVGSRHEAFKLTNERLEKYKMRGCESWFKGPIDEILDCIMAAAELFPVESSEC